MPYLLLAQGTPDDYIVNGSHHFRFCDRGGGSERLQEPHSFNSEAKLPKLQPCCRLQVEDMTSNDPSSF